MLMFVSPPHQSHIDRTPASAGDVQPDTPAAYRRLSHAGSCMEMAEPAVWRGERLGPRAAEKTGAVAARQIVKSPWQICQADAVFPAQWPGPCYRPRGATAPPT